MRPKIEAGDPEAGTNCVKFVEGIAKVLKLAIREQRKRLLFSLGMIQKAKLQRGLFISR